MTSPVEKRMRARILIYPRRDILDPQGKAIGAALDRMGYGEVDEVRAGKTFIIELRSASAAAARGRLEEMCSRLLANPIIEDYSFTLEEVTE
jgi:phosphoribosylformylglycinamidine synthase